MREALERWRIPILVNSTRRTKHKSSSERGNAQAAHPIKSEEKGKERNLVIFATTHKLSHKRTKALEAPLILRLCTVVGRQGLEP